MGQRTATYTTPTSLAKSVQSVRGFRLLLLGGFELRCDDQIVSVQTGVQRLLAFLAIHSRPVQRPYVSGVLWPDTPEDRAAANLRSVLWRLHHVGVTPIGSSGGDLRLITGVEVDLRETVLLARTVLDPAATWISSLADVDRLSAELLPGWYEDWVTSARTRFHLLRLQALEAMCVRLTARGMLNLAAQAGLAAVTSDPLQESARRALIEAYVADGNLPQAIQQFQSYRQLLHRELGTEPSPEMQELIGSFWSKAPDLAAGS